MEKGNNFEDFDFCVKFDLNELERNFRFPLQIISARLVSSSDIPSANRGETNVLSPSWLRDKTESS